MVREGIELEAGFEATCRASDTLLSMLLESSSDILNRNEFGGAVATADDARYVSRVLRAGAVCTAAYSTLWWVFGADGIGIGSVGRLTL